MHYAPNYILAFLRDYDKQYRRPYYHKVEPKPKREEPEDLELPDFEKELGRCKQELDKFKKDFEKLALKLDPFTFHARRIHLMHFFLWRAPLVL